MNIGLKKQRTEIKKVLICGWYGTETLGDKAILAGVILGIRRAQPTVEIELASIEPYVSEFTNKQMPELKISTILTLEGAKSKAATGHYDAICIAGGPLMHGIDERIDLYELMAVGHRQGARTVVAGCGVGPLPPSGKDRFIKGILHTADSVMLRDTASVLTTKKNLKLIRNLKSGVDPAFIWIREQMKRNEAVKAESRKNQILLAVRDWPVHEYAANLDPQEASTIKDKFEAELLNFVSAIHQSHPEIQVIPFCMHKLAIGGDDRAFYRRIFKNCPDILANLDNLHTDPYNDLKLFTESRAVLAMRFHSVVFSIATSTPFLAIDYTLGGKINGLLNDLGLSDHYRSLANFNGTEAAASILTQNFKNCAQLDELIEETESSIAQQFK